MRTLVIRTLFFFLLITLIPGMQNRSNSVQAASVEVDQKTFPDKYFCQYVSDYVDKNKDGKLSDTEIQNTTKIKIEWQDTFHKNITNYQGIEYFTELRNLEIHGMYHASGEDDSDTGVDIKLDVSKNTKLTRFWCEANSIGQLDLSFLPDLTEVELYALKYVDPYPVQDLRNCAKLSLIRVGKNVILPAQMPKLTTCKLWGGEHNVQFQSSNELREIDLVYDVAAKKIELRNMPKLKTFKASGYIDQIDLRGCKKLTTVDTGGSWAKGIKLTGCVNLKKLSYHGRNLGKIDVRKFPKLTYLDCEGQGIKKLDLSKNKKLTYLNCSLNPIGKLNLKNNTRLKTVYCDRCSLTKLQLAPKTSYKLVSCKNNKLKKLNVKSIRIKTLRIKGNKALWLS